MIKIVENPINVQEVLNEVQNDGAGAVSLFLGTVRDNTKEKPVERLEYESYDAMAVSEIEKIVNQALDRWPLCKYAVVHRKGVLPIGEIAVAIAVSTPHRAESFEACRFIIDTLKQTVPIWKKEVFGDGEEWVSTTP